MKRVAGLVIKEILADKAQTCADYFEQPDQKPKINRYWRVYQEVSDALPVNLFPYIALIKELGRLVDA
jgi:glutamate dehydrogenase